MKQDFWLPSDFQKISDLFENTYKKISNKIGFHVFYYYTTIFFNQNYIVK